MTHFSHSQIKGFFLILFFYDFSFHFMLSLYSLECLRFIFFKSSSDYFFRFLMFNIYYLIIMFQAPEDNVIFKIHYSVVRSAKKKTKPHLKL